MTERIDNVYYMEIKPEQMTKEQTQYWIGRAAMHGTYADYLREMAEEEDRHRENALRMVGMLGKEEGLEG